MFYLRSCKKKKLRLTDEELINSFNIFTHNQSKWLFSFESLNDVECSWNVQFLKSFENLHADTLGT